MASTIVIDIYNIFQIRTRGLVNRSVEKITWTAGPLCFETLKLFPQTRTLIAKGNRLRTLDGIQALPFLIYLDCSNNELTILDPIQRLLFLKVLDVSNNRLLSIDVLTDCFRLTALCCKGNSIRNYHVLRYLYNLAVFRDTDMMVNSAHGIYPRCVVLSANGQVENETEYGHNLYAHDPTFRQSANTALASIMRDPDLIFCAHVPANLEYIHELCLSSIVHPIYRITFADLMDRIMARIQYHPDYLTILTKLEAAAQLARYMHIYYRFEGVISALTGYYDDIDVRFSIETQIDKLINKVRARCTDSNGLLVSISSALKALDGSKVRKSLAKSYGKALLAYENYQVSITIFNSPAQSYRSPAYDIDLQILRDLVRDLTSYIDGHLLIAPTA